MDAKKEAETSETPTPTVDYDHPTQIGAALIVLKNGYYNFGLSQDTRLTQNERAARKLAADICRGIAGKILEMGGRQTFIVNLEMKGLMKAIQDEANIASLRTQ